MKSNRFSYRLLMMAGISILSLTVYLGAGATSTGRTFLWAPPLPLLESGQVFTAEPNGDGVFRLWGLCLTPCSDKYGSGLVQNWVEDNWPDSVDLVDLDGDTQQEVAAVIGAWQGRKGPYTIWVNAYHQPQNGAFSDNSFWATSYYAPGYGGSLQFQSGIGSLAAGGNLIPESLGPRRDELAVAAGNQLAVFAYRGGVEGGTPAIEKLFETTVLGGTVRGLAAGDLDGDTLDELAVVTYANQTSTLQVFRVTAAGIDPPGGTWTGTNEAWKSPVIGNTDGDQIREIWVHSQLQNVQPAVDGVLRGFQWDSPTAVGEIPGLGPYDRFTVGPVGDLQRDVFAVFRIDTSGNTVRVLTRDGVSSSEVRVPGSPTKGQIAHNRLYVTGYGSAGRTSGTFLLQVFDIIGSNNGLSLSLLASRVGGVRGEFEPTDLAVVP